MWTRDELKGRAKRVLGQSYWKAFLISLVLALVTGSSNGGGGGNSNALSLNINIPDFSFSGIESGSWREYLGFLPGSLLPGGVLLPLVLGSITLVAVLMMLVHFFVGANLEVGCRRYFTSASAGYFDFNNLGFGFQNRRYWNILCTMLYRSVLTFLWSLLLIIPGIIKSYAYAMVPYILADNPEIHYQRAVQLSNEMTRGHKFDMFVLDLSFIGWYLLGALACGIGVFFVNPYRDSTMAELYLALRHNAIMNGVTTPQELWLA